MPGISAEQFEKLKEVVAESFNPKSVKKADGATAAQQHALDVLRAGFDLIKKKEPLFFYQKNIEKGEWGETYIGLLTPVGSLTISEQGRVTYAGNTGHSDEFLIQAVAHFADKARDMPKLPPQPRITSNLQK